MKHILKIKLEYLNAIDDGIKTFEVRKNDRNYAVGDILVLKSINQFGHILELEVDVNYILNDPEYCKEGYVIMGISVC